MERKEITTALVFMPSWIPFAPTLGITAVAAYLKQNNVHARLFDYNSRIWKDCSKVSHYWEMEYASSWAHIDSYRYEIHPQIVKALSKAALEIIQSNVSSIGFSVYSSNYLPTRFIIKLIKTMCPDIKIYLGGASVDKKLAMQDLEENLIDAAVIGEGENSCYRLLEFWNGQIDIQDLKGVIVKLQDQTIFEAPRNSLLKLADLPLPDFSEYDMSNYHGNVLPIEFSRGCTDSCTFCSETNYWVGFRTKSADQIILEMKANILKHGIREFRVVDSLMNGNFKVLENLVNRIIEEQLEVYWYGFCRIDKRLTPEFLQKMRHAGCIWISFGVESGSQKVLNLMNKRVQIKDLYTVIKNTRSAGIKTNAEMLVGFPGENLIDIFKTYSLIFRLRKYLNSVSLGSALEIVENSDIKNNLEKYNIVYHSSENWRTKNYLNNPLTRKYLLKATYWWIKFCKINEGYSPIKYEVKNFDAILSSFRK